VVVTDFAIRQMVHGRYRYLSQEQEKEKRKKKERKTDGRERRELI